jgi:NADP-dependent 3-hydroxy acid dehydrogenase YdfG
VNCGLGKETARQFLAVGHTIYIGARDEARGLAAADQLGARYVRLDVTDGRRQVGHPKKGIRLDG